MANPMYLFPDPLDIYWIHILPRVDSTGQVCCNQSLTAHETLYSSWWHHEIGKARVHVRV